MLPHLNGALDVIDSYKATAARGLKTPGEAIFNAAQGYVASLMGGANSSLELFWRTDSETLQAAIDNKVKLTPATPSDRRLVPVINEDGNFAYSEPADGRGSGNAGPGGEGILVHYNEIEGVSAEFPVASVNYIGNRITAIFQNAQNAGRGDLVSLYLGEEMVATGPVEALMESKADLSAGITAQAAMVLDALLTEIENNFESAELTTEKSFILTQAWTTQIQGAREIIIIHVIEQLRQLNAHEKIVMKSSKSAERLSS